MTTGSPPRTASLRKLLAEDSTPLSVAFFAAVAAGGYDPEISAMDAEAFIAEIQTNLDIDLSDMISSKIIAGQTVYYTDLVYRDLPAFIDFANLASAEDVPIPGLFNPASVVECCMAVLEIAVIDQSFQEQEAAKPEGRKRPGGRSRTNENVADFRNLFSDEITKYWGAILATEGAAWPIPPLNYAIVPDIASISADADPEMFATISDRTADFKKQIASDVWQRAYHIFEGLKKIPSLDGKPLVTAAQMSSTVTRLVGKQPVEQTLGI
jgi:hypothetical protein